MKVKLFVLIVLICLFTGCDSLRFAPTESQKQNAWLHYRTTQLAADEAATQQPDSKLAALTELSHHQSGSFAAYFGMPREIPSSNTTEDILKVENYELAEVAAIESAVRPDIWDTADGLLELGIAIAGIFGGVYGLKTAEMLKRTREKSKALKEVVQGNEIFKQLNSNAHEAFKQAQSLQSKTTKKLVTELKNN
jgi:hypothetical protein